MLVGVFGAMSFLGIALLMVSVWTPSNRKKGLDDFGLCVHAQMQNQKQLDVCQLNLLWPLLVGSRVTTTGVLTSTPAG